MTPNEVVNVFRVRFASSGTLGSKYDAQKTKEMLELQFAVSGMEAEVVSIEDASEEEKEAFLAYLSEELADSEVPANVTLN